MKKLDPKQWIEIIDKKNKTKENPRILLLGIKSRRLLERIIKLKRNNSNESTENKNKRKRKISVSWQTDTDEFTYLKKSHK